MGLFWECYVDNGWGKPPMNGPCVLVAEDEPLTRFSIVGVLSTAGYRVLEASDGIAALRIALQKGNDIDLLVTDVRMPGLDGLLAREVKSVRPDLRVLILSANHQKHFPPEALAEAHALLKPVEPATLLKKVQELLATSGHPAAA